MKLSEFMDTLDSHELYEPTALAADLKRETGIAGVVRAVGYGRGQLVLKVPVGEEIKTATVPLRTVELLRKSEGAVETGNPKGAYFNDGVDEGEFTVGGYELSAALCRSLLGWYPGSQFFGRGTAFRADVKALEEAGL